MALKDKKILVTGGTGFIGEHLVKRLLALGIKPAIMGRNSTHVAPIFKQLTFHKVDLLDLSSLNKILSRYNTVVHLAGRTGAGHIQDPITDFKINALGTLNLLKAAVENKIKKFINISSYEVYGNPKYLPVDEDHPQKPNNPYGGSLLTREIYSYIFYRSYGLRTLTLRLFNVYGEAISKHNDKGIIAFLIKQIYAGKPILLTGDPDNVRDFIYIDDVSDVIIAAISKEKGIGETINVGTGIGTTLKHLAGTIQGLSGKPNKIKFKCNKSSGTPLKIYANIEKLRKKLNCEIKYDLKRGLLNMVSCVSSDL